MPLVAYYLGRPARVWIAAMSRRAGERLNEPVARPERLISHEGRLVDTVVGG